MCNRGVARQRSWSVTPYQIQEDDSMTDAPKFAAPRREPSKADDPKPVTRKKYSVSRTEIFVANPETGVAEKKMVGDTVELTAAEARDFKDKGCLAPYLDDEE